MDEILNHFGIQIENPLSVLTQDMARSFLASSTPSSRYEFFLKGTGLSQLQLDYQNLEKMIDETKRIYEIKATAIPEMQNEFDQLSATWKSLGNVDKLEMRLEELQGELVWNEIKLLGEFLTKFN